MSNNNLVVLVNEADEVLGEMEKMQAHQAGLLHRAISVFVFNAQNELLIQQRALSKYHSPGLWTNTCCSHPFLGESYLDAAKRRLMEEMGMECGLNPAFSFIYKADVGQGLIEHELDHVFVGYSDEDPTLNPDEAENYEWMAWDTLFQDVENQPQKYTEWFKIILKEYINFLQK